MSTALLLFAVAAALLAVAFWWVRRNNLAVYPVGRRPLELRPLPTGCDLGERLMMAAANSGSGGSASGGGGGGSPASRPKRKKPSGPSRRAFLRNSWAVAWLGVLAGFGGATIAFLWPSLRGGFGAVIPVDTEDAILEYIRSNREPYPYPAGRMYFVAYDPSLDAQGQYADITNGARVMALYQKCVHLGCKVPWCQTAQWFQCPCHGSNYNRWGEWQRGPAPRGLDRFALQVVEGGVVEVDTAQVVTGPSRQSGVLDQPKEGPDCI